MNIYCELDETHLNIAESPLNSVNLPEFHYKLAKTSINAFVHYPENCMFVVEADFSGFFINKTSVHY